MGLWADNYNSWKDYKGRDFLIVDMRIQLNFIYENQNYLP